MERDSFGTFDPLEQVDRLALQVAVFGHQLVVIAAYFGI